MADKISSERRSANMSKIRGKDTKLEIRFRKGLFAQGIRYRLNYPAFGKPDLVMPSKKIAIFINGCFWHHHENCHLAYLPKSNVEFWQTKFQKNTDRDKLVRQKLESDGWKVISVWECSIKDDFEETILSSVAKIKQCYPHQN